MQCVELKMKSWDHLGKIILEANETSIMPKVHLRYKGSVHTIFVQTPDMSCLLSSSYLVLNVYSARSSLIVIVIISVGIS